MTTSPDADVRMALEKAAAMPNLSLDRTAVLAQGHRAARRRRLRHAGVSAAAVVAVAVGVVVGVVGSQREPDRVIVAAPSPAPATTLTVAVNGSAGYVVPTSDPTVVVTYDAARRTGTFVVSHADGSRTRAEVTLDSTVGAGFTVTDAGTDHGVLFMLLPNTMQVRPLPATRFFMSQWAANGNLTGTDLVAIVKSLAHDDPGPQLLYRPDNERGAVFDDGSRVDTGRVSLGPATVVIWVNPSHRVWGSVESVDGQPASGGSGDLVAPAKSGFLQLEGMAGTRDAAGHPVWTSGASGLLPSGATQVRPKFGATQPRAISFGSAVMSGDGWVAVAARCTVTAAEEPSPEEVCRELKGVTWVDRAGAPHFTPLT